MTNLSFTSRIEWLRAERADLLSQLSRRINREDQTPTAELPLNWGTAGDLQHDIELLKQLMRMEH